MGAPSLWSVPHHPRRSHRVARQRSSRRGPARRGEDPPRIRRDGSRRAGRARRASRFSPRHALAILSTGDEVVDARCRHRAHCGSGNSNGISIEILARTAGAETKQLGNAAPDEKKCVAGRNRAWPRSRHRGSLRRRFDGEVSTWLSRCSRILGAEFHFTGVSIRPGRPAVFGTCRNKLVFGLPGNPVCRPW